MIVALHDIEPEQALEAGVCIVGAGAAGITLACELDSSGFKVLLLEAGGLRSDAQAAHRLLAGSALPPHPNPSAYRRVGFGGTTAIWGGRCVPLDPIDFERRDHVPESGWPITHAEIARYYARALAYCDAGAYEFTVPGSLPNAPPTLPGLPDESIVLADRIERYSLPTHFGKRYRDRIVRSRNITTLLHARCVSLNKRAGEDQIESAVVVDLRGRRRRVRARIYVLATGGIETPRLLFNSDPEGIGLGNRTGRLGRFYSCHFENVLGKIVLTRGDAVFGFERTRDGVYCRRKLQFSEAAQKQHRLLNCAFRLHFPSYADARHGSAVLSAIYLAKSALIPEYQAILRQGSPVLESADADHLLNVVRGLPQLVRFSAQWLFGRVLAQRKLPYTLERNADGSLPLEFNSEQTPQESNRVVLTHDLDCDGLRRVHVHWQVCRTDAQAAHRAFLLLHEELQKTACCRLEFDQADLEHALCASVPLGGHHIGTARMAATAREGVVDSQCAVFDLPNLYIASSAVFCTSGHANPTLSIVALAVRLADHLKTAMTPSHASLRSEPVASA